MNFISDLVPTLKQCQLITAAILLNPLKAFLIQQFSMSKRSGLDVNLDPLLLSYVQQQYFLVFNHLFLVTGS